MLGKGKKYRARQAVPCVAAPGALMQPYDSSQIDGGYICMRCNVTTLSYIWRCCKSDNKNEIFACKTCPTVLKPGDDTFAGLALADDLRGGYHVHIE